MTTYIAVHKIGTHVRDVPARATGNFDKDGNPILKNVPRAIQPGELFTESDVDNIPHLLNLGAARLPDETELALAEKRAKGVDR